MRRMLLQICLMLFIPFIAWSAEWEVITTLDSNKNGNSWEFIKSYDSLNIIMVGSEFNGIPRAVISKN
ncbi:MAG: hypothetical protein WCT77_14775, partial [Bacteroidota bacterium]